MNKRIKQLAVQAGLEMCSCGCDMPTRQSAKFAELIVQECAERIKSKSNQFGNTFVIAEDLLTHFGVE
jgi:hypothetical protein